jgi:hypothetical protein
MAVVTVGYIRAGTKNYIIPDRAEMGLTVRTRNAEVWKQILAAITRITKAEALAGGALQEPLIEHSEGTNLVYNDPAQLGARLGAGSLDHVQSQGIQSVCNRWRCEPGESRSSVGRQFR